MHPYSIETDERRNILLILAVISIALAWSFHQLMSIFEIGLPWWTESPSVLFFYGFLYTIFDKWCWKWLRKIRLIKTPDLNGEWDGTLKTSFDSHTSELKTTLKIFQTWTKIKTILTANHSVSYSEAASIILEAPEGKYLSYQYVNEPKSSAVQTMSIHRGTTKLLFDEKADKLSGEYYSGRDRQNFGSLSFTRKT
jgi:hypothetical protein